jgi:alpha-beta hydrolase superfamily lysophospholipase
MRAADGTELFVHDWPVAAGTPRRGSALIVHGLGEHAGRYAHVAAALNAIGIVVRGYDQRGFGRSGGARAAVPSSDALIDDARLMFEALAAEATATGDAAPPFLIGHSMGGAIAARAVTGGWIKPSGVVLSSPALKTRLKGLQLFLVRAGSRLLPNFQSPHGLPLHRISHDTQLVAETLADPLCHPLATPRLVAFIVDAGERARRDAARLDVSVLLLVAGDDRLVDADGAREFAAAAPPALCAVREYPGLYHEVFNEREPDRTRVLADLTKWIEQRIGAARR